MVRILLLCHGFPPASVGGVEQHVEGLAQALAAQGHAVHVLARATLPGLAQGEVQLGAAGNPRVSHIAYRWEGVDSLDAMYHCTPMAAGLMAFLAARQQAGESFDVAHVHHLTGLSTDSLAALRAAGIATVLTLHDYWLFCPRGQMFHQREELCAQAEVARCADCLGQTFPGWMPNTTREASVQRLHERARDTLQLADRLVVPSARAIAPFVALGIARERFAVVENGVDTVALAALPPPAAGPGPLRVLYLGTLLPSKGLHVLLAAIAKLPTGMVQLDIHGNAVPYHGDASYLTRCFANLQPGARVRYHGPYASADLPAILEAGDVVAAPALWQEAFGLTVREALAAGRPILVSRIGGLQDAVTDGVGGMILPPGDVAAWSAALLRLAKNRFLVQQLARGTRALARSFASMAEELANLYSALVAARNP